MAFVDKLQQQGKHMALSQVSLDQAQRMGSGLQPRGARAPLLVGDFKHKIDVKSQGEDVPTQISETVQPPFQGVPLHSKLISSRCVTEEGKKARRKLLQFPRFAFFGLHLSSCTVPFLLNILSIARTLLIRAI